MSRPTICHNPDCSMRGYAHTVLCDSRRLDQEYVNEVDRILEIAQGQAQAHQEMIQTIKGVGPDAPTVKNELGGAQSHAPYRFDLVDGPAMFAMTEVLGEGAIKYGANNWRAISVEDHLNHLIMHAYAYLAGDKSDSHLAHAMCRATFAQAVELQGGPKAQDVNS